MKKIILTAMAVLCCAMTMTAQEPQTGRNSTYRITLNNVQYAHHNEKMSTGDAIGKALTGVLTGKMEVQATKYEGDVKNAIVRGLSSAYRFRYNDGLVELADIAGDGNIIVNAVITNIQAKSDSRSWRDKDDKLQVTSSYQGFVEVMLTLKDAKSGEIIATPTLSGSGMGNSTFSDQDKAIRDAINRLAGRISSWLNNYRPLQANVLEGAAAKKDKQKEIYIDLGSSEGAFAGLRMGVYVVKTIAGYEAKSEIGKVRVEAVEGENISRCKVTSGSKDIKSALDDGEKLKVISID